MKHFLCIAAAVAITSFASAQWSDNFDSYTNGQQLHGVNGWVGWDNVPGAGALVSNAQSLSAPNSVAIAGASDLVQQFSGATSGMWTFKGKIYIPSAFTGTTYFIMLNTYNHGGPYNWSVQVKFVSATNQASDDFGTSTPVTFARDTWIPFQVDIDLTADTRTVTLGGNTVSTGTWTQTGGALNIAAIDLFANNSNAVYYDDLSLQKAGGGPVDVAPSGFTIFRGSLVSGGLAELISSDDKYLVVRNGPIAFPTEAPITVYFDGTYNGSTQTGLSFTIENKVSINGLTQIVDLFNYTTNSYDTTAIDTRPGPTTDTVVTINGTGTIGRFFGTGGALRARLRVRPAGPLFTNNWRTSVDQVKWTVTP